MKRWCLFTALLLLFLCGCQGRSRHTVSGGQGSLEGLQFLPPDHSREVDTDTDPEIFWLPGYEPPAQFTVSLKRIDEYSDLHPVNTELRRPDPNLYRWKLKVVGTLSEGTLYAIIVRDDTRGTFREVWFLTKKSRWRSTPSPQPDRPQRGAFEHTVILYPLSVPALP